MKFIRKEIEGARATISIDRPDVRNALSGEVLKELRAAFDEVGANESVRAVVLRGEGKSFCAGADIEWMRASVDKSVAENEEETRGIAAALRAIDECAKPVIARVHGAALGGGAGLVAACDIVVSADNAKFGFTEVRLGIIPAAISTFVLAKIGSNHARRYFLTGEVFGAEAAFHIGLADEVVKEGELDQAVDAIADAIAMNGPRAVEAAKKMIRDVAPLSREDAIAETTRRIAKLRTSPEGQEGLRAFLEKRRASWLEES
ncbi:MAG: enoyl-CoA hydratase/isomerase family protein [Gemmatimonadetes bacterium]|nr:enoyl-CoA hydratase/isomerase family protein [Gemmatimonadota bacterium]